MKTSFFIKKKIKNFNIKIFPTIIQDFNTLKILMLGYMNKEAYYKTCKIKKVVFYSRSKKRLWIKGEKSGNFLLVKDILIDCDKDTFLIKTFPLGPVCHNGTDTCWKEINDTPNINFLIQLEKIINNRKKYKNNKSYIYNLIKKGINRIAQKVGEEAIELIIESKEKNKERFLNEAADLLFHYLILLKKKKESIKKIIEILKNRSIH